MGCVGQKQNRNQQQNKFQLHRQSISISHSNRKMCIESPFVTDPKQQIQLYRSIDITKDEEFILKSDKKFISKNQESPTTTPKFNQNLQFAIGNRKNKIVL
ncbi:unnamed protein product [Paramecium pentaurelia]|uniref:Uncharacterized protein n=1 Tax=Paramecium pentaurelia TaxID=43138 RepID=A0A8S1VXH2_9CILI|nr:unnamed protein product [Paramecium pentaurelia]